MNQMIAKTDTAGEAIERVIAQGDLSKLTPEQRVRYYNDVCKSLELNPLTRPFEYITLNGKLVLYARKDATEQLRVKRGISIKITAREKVDDVYLVTAQATDKTGRVDESIGAVTINALKGDAMANAIMKCETKAKRRVTLSISGLGFTDETELETIPGAQMQRGNPLRQEFQGFSFELDGLKSREQIDLLLESPEFKEFEQRDSQQTSGMSFAGHIRDKAAQMKAKLPERVEDKRNFVKTIDEYKSAGASSAASSVRPSPPSQPPDIPAALDRRPQEEPDESEISDAERKEMDYLASVDSCDTDKELRRVRGEIETDKAILGDDRYANCKRACVQRKKEIEKAEALA